eukprot:CAMPEP_0167777626 /NCGR_PEP_ID=MMETSP0111_2-20121227/3809_1 /TAXON_ID=91324 /ORGANISM="Lotharella globosa, Strain CCCM811" /LENGTH=81 /DNA_ID=CAMNT_0007667853 /DNA_START=60 /DNA_END=305 /DNA_ORIENTATION=-
MLRAAAHRAPPHSHNSNGRGHRRAHRGKPDIVIVVIIASSSSSGGAVTTTTATAAAAAASHWHDQQRAGDLVYLPHDVVDG